MPASMHRGDAVGRYVILGTLGRGGMGVVFEALDPELDRRVAIKLVAPDADRGSLSRDRLLREGQVLAKLAHPNVVSVFDVGIVADQVFIAMELVRGDELATLRRPHTSVDTLLGLFEQAARGLHAAHEAGLVHRDFKPNNVLVNAQGRVKVLDFGLAGPRSDSANPHAHRRFAARDALGPLSGLGVGGTHAYLAPERRRGGPATRASDQYAFFVALVELLGGEPDGVHLRELQRLRRVPAGLRQLIARGLSADPQQRHSSMDAVASALHQLRSRTHRRAVFVTGGLVGAALAVEVSGLGSAAAPCIETVEGTWTPAERAEFRAALGEAPESLSSPAQGDLDAYAKALETMTAENCEAGRDHRLAPAVVQARRACLVHARRRFRAITAAVAGGGRTEAFIEQPRGAFEDLGVCASQADQLYELPTPRDRDTAMAVSRIRDQIADASAIAWLGEGNDALARLRPLVAEAGALEYEPLLAEALLEAGRAAAATGDLEAAADEVSAAHWMATQHHHDHVAAQSAVAMVTIVGVKLSDERRGNDWLDNAKASVARVGGGSVLAAELAVAEISLYTRHGRYRQAVDAFERFEALSFAAWVPGWRPVLKAWIHEAAAVAFEGAGELVLARSHYEEAMSLMRAALPPDHPDIAQLLVNIAILDGLQGRAEAAADKLESAVSMLSARYSPNHPATLRAALNLGVVLLELDRNDDALAVLQQTKQGVSTAFGVGHPMRTFALVNLAEAQLAVGAVDDAQTSISAAGERIATAVQFDSVERVAFEVLRGRVAVRRGRNEDASESLSIARDILTRVGADEMTRAGVERLSEEIELLTVGL